MLVGGVLTACGNSESGSQHAGAGADSGGASSGASPGGSSSAGSVSGVSGTSGVGGMSGVSGNVNAGASAAGSAAMTKYEACVTYMNAQCNKRYLECRGFDTKADPCPAFMRWCPDFLFSEGSQLDIPSVLACAETWRHYSCDLLNKGFDPDCGLASGTRALGEPCKYGRQCQSNECAAKRGVDNARLECGQCVPVGGAGDPCDDGSFACGDGYECTGSGCQSSLQFDLADGAVCQRYAQCHGLSLCFPASDGMMRCQPQRKAGEDCSNGAYCESGTICGNDKLCQVQLPAKLGESCADRPCAPDGWCTYSTTAADQLVCVAKMKVGESCQVQDRDQDLVGNCGAGLSCFCAGTPCTPTCLYERREGDTCGDALSFCVPGTTCDSGKCVGVELQGLAKAACGQ